MKAVSVIISGRITVLRGYITRPGSHLPESVRLYSIYRGTLNASLMLLTTSSSFVVAMPNMNGGSSLALKPDDMWNQLPIPSGQLLVSSFESRRS